MYSPEAMFLAEAGILRPPPAPPSEQSEEQEGPEDKYIPFQIRSDGKDRNLYEVRRLSWRRFYLAVQQEGPLRQGGVGGEGLVLRCSAV